MTNVYSWDEVGCEVSTWKVELPGGLSDEDALLLADAKITQQCDGRSLGTFDKKVRATDGILILDARFGRDNITRVYLCRPNPARAKALAEKELEILLED